MDKLSGFVLLTICAFAIHEAGALKCYVCNSKQDPRCLDPTNEKSPLELTDCTTDQRQRTETRQAIEKISEMLQKLGSPSIPISAEKSPSQIWASENYPMSCQKLEISAGGDMVTGRGCSAPRMERFDPCEAVKLITNEKIVLESCSLCDTDGCNKGIAIRSFSIGLILNFLIVLIMT